MVQILLDNRFSILHLESTNNFSKVLFALDTYQNPPRNCAIKLYKPITQKTQIKEWITQEFHKKANELKQLSLSEPHLPEIYTYLSDRQGYYIVRELIEGITLRKQVQTQGVLSPKTVRTILSKLLVTLEYLHHKKVIHQNIKPKNIILRRSDRTPISINFGSIKQIVATFDLHNNKNIFSLNDVFGYTPSEQALGMAIPASDFYSLGLTAIYLLTAQDPVDLQIEINSGYYKIPTIIKERDRKLAEIIRKATSFAPEDRYQSAREMLDDLWEQNIKADEHSSIETDSIADDYLINAERVLVENDLKDNTNIAKKYNSKWVIILILIVGCISLTNLYLIIKYLSDFKDDSILQVPESPILLPEITSKIPERESSKPNKRSILSDELKSVLEIPIFITGSPKEKIRNLIGEPNAIKKGYWKNSSAWIYNKQANGAIDLGYLFDINTGKLRQTEIAIAQSIDLLTTEEILDNLLQGNLDPAIKQGLKRVYDRQINVYSFSVGNLEGSIEREKDDNIYIGIWEADFH